MQCYIERVAWNEFCLVGFCMNLAWADRKVVEAQWLCFGMLLLSCHHRRVGHQQHQAGNLWVVRAAVAAAVAAAAAGE